jgi:TatD DNase family protein
MLTDSHCHLDFEEFSSNLPKLLGDCFEQGIHQIIIPSVAPDNWNKVLELAISVHKNNAIKSNQTSKPTSKKQCDLFACLGIHPWYLNELGEKHLAELSDIVHTNQKNIIAIGETGIDGTIAKEHDNLNKQITFFDFQLALAKQYRLPVIVHHRRSHEHIVQRLKQQKIEQGGIIHAFSGSYQQAKTYIDLGLKLGIGGTITYERAKKTINAIKRLPLNSLVLETDAPSMPLNGFQGEPNSPLRLLNIVDCLCEIRRENKETIIETIEQNIQSLFFNR